MIVMVMAMMAIGEGNRKPKNRERAICHARHSMRAKDCRDLLTLPHKDWEALILYTLLKIEDEDMAKWRGIVNFFSKGGSAVGRAKC